ncbi:hypothetical protein HPP92_025083 [Vanilla planifolia]|uniref:Uncharacterized protein n=1 Tax=Vanilla planifolia TaxID=51239 RepID=A0A835PL77_VANPL|nr:hypothetical protein HPP92_025353 [Vanilla planifolia]KAG0453779.1 hypothetical protein HPP92_025083 [Vanilla planifolia]
MGALLGPSNVPQRAQLWSWFIPDESQPVASTKSLSNTEHSFFHTARPINPWQYPFEQPKPIHWADIGGTLDSTEQDGKEEKKKKSSATHLFHVIAWQPRAWDLGLSATRVGSPGQPARPARILGGAGHKYVGMAAPEPGWGWVAVEVIESTHGQLHMGMAWGAVQEAWHGRCRGSSRHAIHSWFSWSPYNSMAGMEVMALSNYWWCIIGEGFEHPSALDPIPRRGQYEQIDFAEDIQRQGRWSD